MEFSQRRGKRLDRRIGGSAHVFSSLARIVSAQKAAPPNGGKADILQVYGRHAKDGPGAERGESGDDLHAHPGGMLQCNCLIIGDPKTHEALVVDPGDEVERILSMLGRYKLKVQAIISTHAHIDHVGGLAKLHQYTGAPVMMHGDDLPLYHGMEVQAAFLGVPT